MCQSPCYSDDNDEETEMRQTERRRASGTRLRIFDSASESDTSSDEDPEGEYGIIGADIRLSARQRYTFLCTSSYLRIFTQNSY